MFITTVLLLVILFPIINQVNGQNYVKNHLENNDSKNIDVLGMIAKIADMALTRASLGNVRPRNQLCATYRVKISDIEIPVSGQPRGSCSYCCPIIHPKKYVKLHFTNRYLRENMVQLNLSNTAGSLRAAGLKNNIPTVIYTHGFAEHGLGPLSLKIRDAYLSRPEERNIIIVDWGELSPLPWYPHAVKNIRVVAKLLTDFISYYHNTGELPISQLHLVGFSLGAHLSGSIGKALQPKHKLLRITGLDPAGPLFSIQDSSQRLSKDDAEYVDVIHTDGGLFGMSASLGHADFYPNGGVYTQPGCSTSYLAENRTIEHFGSCGHLRVVELYAESVRNSKAFPVYKCVTRCKRSRNAYMGFIATKETAVGDFYLETNEQSPFGKFSTS